MEVLSIGVFPDVSSWAATLPFSSTARTMVPLTDPVKVELLIPPPPPPPPPPHVQRIIARKTRSNEAGIYVKKNFLIWVSLLYLFLTSEKGVLAPGDSYGPCQGVR